MSEPAVAAPENERVCDACGNVLEMRSDGYYCRTCRIAYAEARIDSSSEPSH